MVHKFFYRTPGRPEGLCSCCGPADDIVVPFRWVISETPVDDGDDASIRFISDQAADTLLEVDDHLRHADLHQGIIRNRRLIVNDRIGYRKG